MSTEEKLAAWADGLELRAKFLSEADEDDWREEAGASVSVMNGAAAELRRLSAEVQELREALNIGVMAFTDIAQFRPSGPLDNFQQIASHARATTLEALPPMRAALKPETVNG